MPKKNKRSAAAKKGWETRRRNARSLAAKKGWQTRRRNARSLAAKKRWQTRRRNLRKKKQKRSRKEMLKKQMAHEYIVNVIHEQKTKKSPRVDVQISVTGPSNRSRKQVLQAVEHRLETGRDFADYQSRIMVWERAGKGYDSKKNEEGYWEALGRIISKSRMV